MKISLLAICMVLALLTIRSTEGLPLIGLGYYDDYYYYYDGYGLFNPIRFGEGRFGEGEALIGEGAGFTGEGNIGESFFDIGDVDFRKNPCRNGITSISCRLFNKRFVSPIESGLFFGNAYPFG